MSGWKGGDNPKDQYGAPFKRLVGGRAGYLWNRNDIKDEEINKLLKQGKNPRSQLANKIKQMSSNDRADVNRRIAAAEKRRNQ
jgi:uncharacterized protein involved in tolerance to divalent cations